MKDTKHTPGPWRVIHTIKPEDILVIDSEGCSVADCFNHNANNIDEALANSRLIAAAPELLEASGELLDAMNQYSFFLEGYGNGSASISEVREASSKMTYAQHKLFDVIQKAKGL